MRRSLSLLALVTTLIVGACGGGGGGSNSAYCQQLKNAAKEALSSTSTSAANMAALQTAFDKALDKISAKAPSEIKDDYSVLKQYVDLRFQAVVDPSKADTAKITELGKKYQAAQKNITDYNTKVCKFDTSTTRATSATTSAPATTTTTAKK